MIIIRSIVHLIVVSAVVAVFVVALGWFSQSQTEAPSAKLDLALGHAREITAKCSSTIDPRMRQALHVYLAIEDFFRPEYIRKLEFVLARFGTVVGLNPIGTLGIGQIARQTYVSTVGGADLEVGAARDWIDDLANDCRNVALLQAYARQNNVSCDEKDGVKCMILLVCFWHTGKDHGCDGNPGRSYLANAVTTYLRARRYNQPST